VSSSASRSLERCSWHRKSCSPTSPRATSTPRTGRRVIDALYSLNAAGQTIVLVTHDRSIADEAPRLVSLLDGRIGKRRVASSARWSDMASTALAAAVSVLRLINFRAIRRHTLRALLASLSLGGGGGHRRRGHDRNQQRPHRHR